MEKEIVNKALQAAQNIDTQSYDPGPMVYVAEEFVKDAELLAGVVFQLAEELEKR